MSSPTANAKNKYHHGNLRHAIEETAMALIESGGPEAVSLRAIGRRLGVTEAAPYHHFANKAELLAVLAARGYIGLQARIEAALDSAGDDPFDRLAALGRAYVEYGLENRGRFRLMFGEHMVEITEYPLVYEAGHPGRVILSEVVADCLGGDSPDAQKVENTAWALMHGLTWLINESEIRFDEDGGDADSLIECAVGILVGGIRSRLAS